MAAPLAGRGGASGDLPDDVVLDPAVHDRDDALAALGDARVVVQLPALALGHELRPGEREPLVARPDQPDRHVEPRERVLEVLAQALHDEGYLDLQEAFIDGSFAPAKQGGASIGKTKRGKGSKIMAIADRQGLPVAANVESATPHEVTLVHATLAQRFVKPFPVRLIGDNAYESDRLDADLARRGVELIAPHRKTRTSRTQGGRPLRRYRRRWKIERLFAWFQNFRRLVVRYERYAENFLAMLHLACCLILLRGL